MEFRGGERHHIRFIIPENVMNASADELEERSRNRTPQLYHTPHTKQTHQEKEERSQTTLQYI